MPGFLAASGYDGTERLTLAPGYWADLKKCLSEEEAGWAEAAMMGKVRAEMSENRQYADLDTRAGRVELVVQSLHAWNVADDDGTEWPIEGVRGVRPGTNPYPAGCDRRKSVARLPSPVFDAIWAKCDELNQPRPPGEAAGFPDQPVSGDTDGNPGTP